MIPTFAEKLADLINEYLTADKHDEIVSAMELHLMALKEENSESLRAAEAD